jgi:hypothetical protein
MPKVQSLPGVSDDYESRVSILPRSGDWWLTLQFFIGDIVFFKSQPELRAFVAVGIEGRAVLA